MTDSEILDAKALHRLREWGGDKLTAQMIHLFLENAPARMEQIRTGATGPELREADRGAHSLKSSAANIGAERVRNLCADIERAASAGDAATVSSLFPSLEEAFSQAIAALESVQRGLSK